MTDLTFDTPGSSDQQADPGFVAGVQYDRYKRYLIPRPGDDPEDLQPWTRVTTLTGMLTSNEGLRVWTERNIVKGIGLRADLRALLASDPDDKATQDQVLATAKEVAGVGSSASWGRALHRAVERHVDPAANGAPPLAPDLSEQFGRDTQAALECLVNNGIKVRMVETVIVHETLGYAGRLDALWEVTLPDGRVVLRVGDVKTGDKLDHPAKRMTMGAQLAAYVNATHMYDPASRTFTRLPAELDLTTGYILSVRDGVACLYEIDLTTGWTDMLIAVKLHRRRKASTDMFPVGRPVRVEEPAAPHVPVSGQEAQQLAAGQWPTAPVVAEPCPGDPMHPRSAHDPGGAWYGVPLDHSQTAQPSAAQAGADRVAALVEEANAPVVVEPIPTVPAIALGVPAPAFNVGTEHAAADVPASEPERGPTGRRRRTCSICRQPGHIARTCPSKDNPQPPAQPVDNGADDGLTASVSASPPSSMAELVAIGRSCTCSTPPGWSVPPWTSRPDVMVCGGCGLPSAATLAKVQGERAGVQGSAALAQVRAADAPPPWQAAPEPADLSLMDRLNQVGTKDELQELWQRSSSEWSVEHTQRARELLPTLQ